MFFKPKHLFFLLFVSVFMYSCQQAEDLDAVELKQEVPQEIIDQIRDLGFDVEMGPGVIRFQEGFIVENDIFLTEESIKDLGEGQLYVLEDRPDEEQYRTTNLVSVSGSRNIQIWVDPVFGSAYFASTDQAIADYNNENLTLTMSRTTNESAADIRIVAFYEEPSGGFITLGSAGFPTSAGDPHDEIRMNTYYYNIASNQVTLTTTIAHEMGHCIGFRHTDYFNRKISCRGERGPGNEGSAGIGAIAIPGTPTNNKGVKSDDPSFMLACGNGTPRPFTATDKIALDYLY